MHSRVCRDTNARKHLAVDAHIWIEHPSRGGGGSKIIYIHHVIRPNSAFGRAAGRRGRKYHPRSRGSIPATQGIRLVCVQYVKPPPHGSSSGSARSSVDHINPTEIACLGVQIYGHSPATGKIDK